MDGRQFINEYMTMIQKYPPRPARQAGYLLDAMEAIIKKKAFWKVETINRKFVQMKGGQTVKKDMDITEKAVTGRLGEAVLYEAVQVAFSKPEMRKRWGITTVSTAVNILIPVDVGDVDKTDFSYLEKQTVRHARDVFKRIAGKKMTDFLFQGQILEAKATVRDRVYPKGKVPRSRTDVKGMLNEYIDKFSAKGRHTLVGVTVVDAIYMDVGIDIRRRIEKEINELGKTLTDAGKKVGGKTLRIQTNIGKTKTGGIYELLGYEIVAFIPEVVGHAKMGRQIESAIRPLNYEVGEFLLREIAQRRSQKTTYIEKVGGILNAG